MPLSDIINLLINMPKPVHLVNIIEFELEQNFFFNKSRSIYKYTNISR